MMFPYIRKISEIWPREFLNSIMNLSARLSVGEVEDEGCGSTISYAWPHAFRDPKTLPIFVSMFFYLFRNFLLPVGDCLVQLADLRLSE